MKNIAKKLFCLTVALLLTLALPLSVHAKTAYVPYLQDEARVLDDLNFEGQWMDATLSQISNRLQLTVAATTVHTLDNEDIDNYTAHYYRNADYAYADGVLLLVAMEEREWYIYTTGDAYDYLTEHPDAVAIVTGGKGPDEPITEAECMYDHLTAMGIAADRVWMEPNATSTWENLNFSLDLIEEKTGQRPEKIGLLSSEYHLFRAKLFAKECGVEAAGIPAHTTRVSQMINHFMREVAGIWHYIILGGQYD
jgi:hypothetical protein